MDRGRANKKDAAVAEKAASALYHCETRARYLNVVVSRLAGSLAEG